MKFKSPFLTMAANTSILITVVSLIALIAMTAALDGIESIVILLTTIPLLLTLRNISKEKRSGIFMGSLLAMLYFCGGILALFSGTGADTSAASDNADVVSLVAFIYTLAVTCWFLSSVLLIKTLSLTEKSLQED